MIDFWLWFQSVPKKEGGKVVSGKIFTIPKALGIFFKYKRRLLGIFVAAPCGP